MFAWHVTFPDVQVHTVLRSLCQRWPSSTWRPSHTHRRLTHSHPSSERTRDRSSSFWQDRRGGGGGGGGVSVTSKLLFEVRVTSCVFLSHLSFDHVQHCGHVADSPLQFLQPLVPLILRNRPPPQGGPRGAQCRGPLQLVTLHVLGIMAGFVTWPLAFGRFTGRGMALLRGVGVRRRAAGIFVLLLRKRRRRRRGRRQGIWREEGTERERAAAERDVALKWLREEMQIPEQTSWQMSLKLVAHCESKQTVWKGTEDMI